MRTSRATGDGKPHPQENADCGQQIRRWSACLLAILILVACNVSDSVDALRSPDSRQATDHTNFLRGLEHLNSEQYRAAIAEFDLALQRDGRDAYAYLGRGMAQAGLIRFNEAAADYSQAIDLLPASALTDRMAVMEARGNIHYELGNYAAAWADYDQTVQLDPDRGGSYVNRGIASFLLGDYAGSFQDFDKAIQLEPDNSLFYYYRGHTQHLAGCYMAAITDYNMALQLAPLFPEVEELRQQALAGRGNDPNIWVNCEDF